MTITKRTIKGSALTYAEMDENLRDLDSDMTLDRVLKNEDSSNRSLTLGSTGVLSARNITGTGGTILGLPVLKQYVNLTQTQTAITGSVFNLQVGAANNQDHPRLVSIIKPQSTSSVFKITIGGILFVGAGYMYATVGRAINSSKTGFNNGDALLNLAHINAGGDGSSNASFAIRHHNNAHVCGSHATLFDTPNTTNYVRYSVLVYEGSSGTAYFPHTGHAELTITELDASYTETSMDAVLTTTV